MAEYIKLTDAIEATWQILNGLGYSQKVSDRLVEEVDAVFDEFVRCRDGKVDRIINEVKGWR